MWIKKHFLTIIVILSSLATTAQESWSSPELEQMYRHARENMAMGNMKDAIVNYRQLITLAPGRKGLKEELGDACFRAGEFTSAEEILQPLAGTDEATPAVFQLLSASLDVQHKTSKAMSVVRQGLDKFPGSGLLCHQLAVVLLNSNHQQAALEALLIGMNKDPAYTANYLESAKAYLSSKQPLWGLLYGEIYLNMTTDAAGADELKSLLLAGWKKWMHELNPQNKRAAFDDAVTDVFFKLTPIVSDGISTENLVMLRTRFLMNWYHTPGVFNKFPLFSYLDTLIREGWFDIYNQWLFGKAESKVQFDASNKFHEGDLARFEKWRSTHLMKPARYDAYNNGDTDDLFPKKKKR